VLSELKADKRHATKKNQSTGLQTMNVRHTNLQIHYLVVCIVIVFGSIGIYLLSGSHALTPSGSNEAESGTVSSCASTLSDTTASGSSAVKFNGCLGTVIFNQNYDSLPVSNPVSVATERLALGDSTLNLGSSNLARTSIVAVSGRGNVMRITMPPNTYSEASGVIIDALLSKTVDEASIQYDIRFDSSFDWSLGGKLPGLGGAEPGTPASVAGGCTTGNSNAWSGRGMWITPKSYGSVTGTNEWIGYMYNYNKTSTCGDNQRTGKAFTLGTWHTVKQYYKMNTIASDGTPNADGVHKMWLDGVLIKDTENFLYRNNAGLHINYLYWEIFRGGGSTWISPTQGILDIDNLTITSP